jgi:hypothetical protein
MQSVIFDIVSWRDWQMDQWNSTFVEYFSFLSLGVWVVVNEFRESKCSDTLIFGV